MPFTRTRARRASVEDEVDSSHARSVSAQSDAPEEPVIAVAPPPKRITKRDLNKQRADLANWDRYVKAQEKIRERQQKVLDMREEQQRQEARLAAMGPPLVPVPHGSSSWDPSWSQEGGTTLIPPVRAPSPQPTEFSTAPSTITGLRTPRSAASSTTTNDKVPPLPSISPFTAKDLADWMRFKNQMVVHFLRHETFYQLDRRRVDAAAGLLDEERTSQWLNYRENLARENLTWRTFEDWATSLVADPDMVAKDSVDEWYRTKQYKNQSVTEYSTKLVQLERLMRPERTREQKIERLRSGLVEEISVEARKYVNKPAEGDAYNAWLRFYEKIEKQLPERQTAIKKKEHTSHQPAERPSNPQGQHKNDRQHSVKKGRGGFKGSSNRPPRPEEVPNTGEKRKRDDAEDRKQCTHCKLTGHTEDVCYRKHGFPADWPHKSKK
ncbi:hypothetical protein N7481_010299 [Penicillium waksmanii]|uniref:uncharacterized protein n=1 Tax=Penicillium waksmanii TaxID=69791 RepID=UPI0025488665|nr:uncharacterized protein N7481_010299 [Penicillium waksmanii]KAJ5976592.1 hypothetical protein N7481_010299 [Penicillium waksmanii]